MEKTSYVKDEQYYIERIQNTLEFIASYKDAKDRRQKMIAELKQGIQNSIEAIRRLTLDDKQDDEWIKYNEKMLAGYKQRLAEQRTGREKNNEYRQLLF